MNNTSHAKTQANEMRTGIDLAYAKFDTYVNSSDVNKQEAIRAENEINRLDAGDLKTELYRSQSSHALKGEKASNSTVARELAIQKRIAMIDEGNLRNVSFDVPNQLVNEKKIVD